MFTGHQLANYCLDVYAAKWVYWYGTYGKKCTKKLYNSKRKQYPSHYGDSRTAGYMKDIAEGKTCADCVGMIKSFFWKNGDLNATPVYKSNNCPDVSANGMIKLCEQTGAISTIPDVPGLVVWKDGHIGVYVGDGYTVEMKGFNYDCKKNKVKDGPWKKWGRLPASMISYSGTPEPTPTPPAEPKTVEIVGGDCYVRTAPNTDGKKLGVAHRGDKYPYGGQTSDNGWNLIDYKNQNGWVSGKYSRLIE